MSEATLKRLRTIMRRVVKLALAAQALSIGVIVGILAQPAIAQMPGAGEIMGAARTLAESAPLDVTRLALQTAIVAMLVGLVAVASLLKIIHAQAQRPCVLTSEQGRAVAEKVMREAMRSVKKERES